MKKLNVNQMEAVNGGGESLLSCAGFVTSGWVVLASLAAASGPIGWGIAGLGLLAYGLSIAAVGGLSGTGC